MKVYSKNGNKYEIKPKQWWNINCWIWALDQCEAVESQNMPSDGIFNFPNGEIFVCK